MNGIKYAISALFISCLLFLLSSCSDLESLIDSDTPTILGVSTGDYTDKIAVSWTVTKLESGSGTVVDHYTVSWSWIENFVTQVSSLDTTATTCDISGVTPGIIYTVTVTAIIKNSATGAIVELLASNEKTGFAMDADTMIFHTNLNGLSLGGAREYWFETMLQKGFAYDWAGLPPGATITCYAKGTIDNPEWTATSVTPDTSFECDTTGNAFRFYIKIGTPDTGNYSITYWYRTD